MEYSTPGKPAARPLSPAARARRPVDEAETAAGPRVQSREPSAFGEATRAEAASRPEESALERTVMRRHPSDRAAGLFAVAALALGAAPCPAQKAKAVDFAHDVAPIIRSRCAECHTNGKYKGSLSM